MFEALADRITGVVERLRGKRVLTEGNIESALKEVRLSLLEADVNFRVVRQFLNQVKERALGQEVLGSLSPGQMFVKVVYDELVKLMGEQAVPLSLEKRPAPIMVVGLQGSGKTTTIGKLARFLMEKQGLKPYLVPADVYRPAAIEQLRKLGEQLGVAVHPASTNQDPVEIAKQAVERAKLERFDAVLIDTAGRLHIDEELMEELRRMKEAINPAEILFVADAMTGQEAVNVAKRFDELLDCTGFILTKMDGDARGGAALSIRAVTGKPLKFIGVGEKLDALEVFHPDRIASRILGMGDVLTLIEKAQEQIEREQAEELVQRMMQGEFTLEDFLVQLDRMSRMGPMGDILSLLPGIGTQFKELTRGEGAAELERQMKKFRAIVQSMTKLERSRPSVIDISRKKRIAAGSGTSLEDVNALLAQYDAMRLMMKRIGKLGLGWFMKAMLKGGGIEELARELTPSQAHALAQKMEMGKNPEAVKRKAKAKEKARAKAKMIKKQKKQMRKKKKKK